MREDGCGDFEMTKEKTPQHLQGHCDATTKLISFNKDIYLH
jgi:hypothetical protein